MLTKFIEAYLNEESGQYYESGNAKPGRMGTCKVTLDDFKEKVLDDRSFEHCFVEIYKQHCPGCNAASVVIQALHNKLKSAGLEKNFPIFQVSLNDDVPFLG